MNIRFFLVLVWLATAGYLFSGTTAWGADPSTTDSPPSSEPLTETRLNELFHLYWQGFGSDKTSICYGMRLNGPKGENVLESPSEIQVGRVRGQDRPYGYGSGIEDCALSTGQLLYAFCDAYEAVHETHFADHARKLFQGMKNIAAVTPVRGFVPRGPHPDGKSYYKDSSRDQHAAFVEALWRYGRTNLATDQDKQFIKEILQAFGQRMEQNQWFIKTEDNSRIAKVGFCWASSGSLQAASLLSVLAMLHDATGNPHWKELYDQYSSENDSVRWKKELDVSAVDHWQPLTLYSNQFCQALDALRRTDTCSQPQREQIDRLLRALGARYMHSNVFDPRFYRRADWSEKEWTDEQIEEYLNPYGLSLKEPRTPAQVYQAFKPSYFEKRKPYSRPHDFITKRLMFGLTTSAMHAAMLSLDPQLIAEARPVIDSMINTMSKHGDLYDNGENYHRSVLLGLLLLTYDRTDH